MKSLKSSHFIEKNSYAIFPNINIVFLFLLLIIGNYSYSQTPAFPNAEGFGKFTIGGRGGDVYKVTNLNDNGPGSFREACNVAGPRTIVFDVSGNIHLNSDLIVSNGNLTIAGQTAPGDGICIKGSSFIVQASNVIVRYLRFRLGDNGYKDASGNVVGSDSSDSDSVGILGQTGGTNDIIFDHCSMSWSIDEIVEIYGSPNASDGVSDVTFQYCIFSEALYDNHHTDGSNSQSFRISENTSNVTLYKNLFSSSWESHIRSEGGCTFEMINNVIYNFRSTSLISTANQFSLINNHYKKGEPLILSEYMADYIFQAGYPTNQNKAYASGNTSDYSGLTEIDGALIPFIQPTPPLDSGINPDTVNDAINDILENSGAILPLRDAVDLRVINDYNNTTATIIDTQAEVGGYPTLNSTSPLLDTDNDGMPDTWEISRGLDINDPADRNVTNGEGYTNLELYLNGVNTVFSAGSDVTICEGESAVLTASGDSDFLWSTGETTASITVNPVITTTYTVSGTDENGDPISDEVTVFVNPVPIADAGDNAFICNGESTTITASGGDTYLWSNGETTASISVSPTSTTTYTVTVNQNGCEDSDSTIVVVYQLPTADAGADVTISQGESTTLTASGGGTYLWNTGETTASIIVSPTATTTYSVTVSQNGCEATDAIIVTVNGSTTANAGADVTICEGESTTLTASGGGTYLWNTGATTASITINPNSTTTYSVTVTLGSVSDSDDVTVFVNPLPVANAGADVTICEGGNTTLTASGGDAYLWNTGATTASISVNPNTTTIYNVTVIQNGCESTDEVTVTVNSLPTANAGADVTINEGESTTLTASGGDFYLWNTGATTASITVSPITTTTYSVTVYQNGCETTDDVTVTVNGSVTANAGEDVTLCLGESTTLTASGGDYYLWNTGATTASITVNPNANATYSVTVSIGTISDTDEVTVFVNPLPNVVVSDDASILTGEYITLSASGANSYLWSNGATQANIAVNPNETATYYVTGFINNCSETEAVTVNVFEYVNASAGDNQTICLGDEITLTASGGDTYLWSTGETTQDITISPTEDAIYSVLVSNPLDSNTAEVSVFVEDCDVEIPDPEFEFNIYYDLRNDDLLTIRLSGLNDISSIYIQDILGNLILKESFDDNNGEQIEKKIRTSLYSSGVYLITLEEKNKRTTKRILFH